MFKKKRLTQAERIEQELLVRGKKGVTSLDAFKHFGITRLSAIIFNLRKKGLNISSNKYAIKNRYGEKVYFSRYILEETIDKK